MIVPNFDIIGQAIVVPHLQNNRDFFKPKTKLFCLIPTSNCAQFFGSDSIKICEKGRFYERKAIYWQVKQKYFGTYSNVCRTIYIKYKVLIFDHPRTFTMKIETPAAIPKISVD